MHEDNISWEKNAFPAENMKIMLIGGTTDAGDEGALWIVKPSDSSRGRGVYLLRELGELAYDRLSIVQRWISLFVSCPTTAIIVRPNGIFFWSTVAYHCAN